MSQMLSPPSSPRDHRHYIPRRPSPLSLPPMAPSLSLGAASEGFQALTLTALGFDSPKPGAKVPRYPLEKQRRAWKDFEDQKQQKDQQQQMQGQPPMQVARQGTSSSQDYLSSTTSLPLTPRTSGSSGSSRYSDEVDELNNGKSKAPGKRPMFLTLLFGSCFAAFRTASSKIENSHNVRHVVSAR